VNNMPDSNTTSDPLKRVFITGGASGLGRAIALRYAQEGYQVCIGDVNDERGHEVLAELLALGNDACYLPCNVTIMQDLENVQTTLTERWGGVDIVVNNAGVGGTSGPIDEVPLEDWDWVLDVNLKGVMRGVRAFTPLFKQQNSGYFVNIASAAGLFSPAYMGAYNAAKAGVISLSESSSYELAPFNIGTTVVCPAFFQTNLMENMKFTVDGVDENIGRLMAKSSVSADDIADEIFNAVNEQQFMVLPHKMVRQHWGFKRNKPEEFAEIMKVEGLKLAQKHQFK
jgi:NAD(P)-dependent dehydrogenase (short-subunit alcohol dehydrogenase family)